MERVRAKWYQNDAHAFVLERQDESFDERNTPVLANGAETGCDSLAITPILEHAAPELLAEPSNGMLFSLRRVRHEAVLMVKPA